MAALIAIVPSCDEVVVTPVDVTTVLVQPEQAQVIEGGTVQFHAELQDENGGKVTGHQIVWLTDNESVATVDATGRVSGARSGTTTIRARVGAAEGQAEVRVLIPPSVALDPTAISVAVDSGTPRPPPVDVSITNGGEGQLTGLAVTTDYGGSPAGWLSTTLSGTTAPATLTIEFVDIGDLAPGDYQATVNVAASSAPDEVAPLVVELEIRRRASPPQKPVPPADLSAELSQPDEARLSWTPQDDAATEFRIERRTGEDSFDSAGVVDGGSTSFVDGGLKRDIRYTYRVRACNAAGCSDYSNQAAVTTAPSAPSDLWADIVQHHRVRVAWTNNSVTEPVFHVERAVGSGSFSLLVETREGATFHDDRSVETNTTYRYRVMACNSGGCSERSNTISVTTPD